MKIRDTWHSIFSKKKSSLLLFPSSLRFICHFTSPPSHSHFHFTSLHFTFISLHSFHFTPSIKVPFRTISFSWFSSNYLCAVKGVLSHFPQLETVSATKSSFRSQKWFPQPASLCFQNLQSTVSAIIMKCRCNWAKDMGHLQDIKEEQLVRSIEQEMTKFP